MEGESEYATPDILRGLTFPGIRPLAGKSLSSFSKKSETAAPIRYTLSHWRALTRYVDDGLLEMTTRPLSGRFVPSLLDCHFQNYRSKQQSYALR